MQKMPHVFPILGGRKVEQLYANMEALEIALSDEQIAYLEGILPFVKGFPYSAALVSLPFEDCTRCVTLTAVSGRRRGLRSAVQDCGTLPDVAARSRYPSFTRLDVLGIGQQ